MATFFTWPKSVNIFILLAALIGTQTTVAKSSGPDNCYDGYKELATKPRAWAMVLSTSKNYCWYQWGASSRKLAEREALAACRKKARDCRLLNAESDIALLREQEKEKISLTKKQEKEKQNEQFAVVEQAQTLLKALDLYSGRVDGKMGPQTIASIKAFQRSVGLNESGEIYSYLLQRLSEASRVSSLGASDLCNRATNGDRTQWVTTNFYSVEVKEAQRRGLSIDNCRSALGLSPAQTDASPEVASEDQQKPTQIATDAIICRLSLNTGKNGWDTEAYSQYSAEAKHRNLSVNDCRSAIGLDPLGETEQSTAVAQVSPPTLSIKEICERSLNPDRSDWSSEASAMEARKRASELGVSIEICRVTLGVSKDPQQAVNAAEPKPNAIPGPGTSEKRVALVIGNSAYVNAPELANPRNDAEAISSKLRELGFEVITGTDLDKRGTETKISEFVDKSSQADISLFFYAGHGIQVSGENYIVPVDAKVEKPSAVDFELVNVDMITNYLGGDGRIGVALLDACRNNPFTRSLSRALGSRSSAVGTGLAELKSNGGGLLVAFATAPGDVADDGVGMADSPFTTALLRHLGTKGLEVELMMKRVKADVIDMTKNGQRPWTNSDLSKEVYLAGH